MQNESILSQNMIKQTLVNSIRLIVDDSIEKRLAPIIKVLEKSNYSVFNRGEVFEILDVSPSTIHYYHQCGLLNSAFGQDGSFQQWYKLSEVLALINS